MPLNPADWSVTQATKVIEFIGSGHAGDVSVEELGRWLEDLADNAGWSGDDEIGRTDDPPTDRKFEQLWHLINGYTITDNAMEHVYGGTIEFGEGPTRTVFDPINVTAPAGTRVNLLQNGSRATNDFWNTGGGINPDPANNISARFCIKTVEHGVEIDAKASAVTMREWGKDFKELQIPRMATAFNAVFFEVVDDTANKSTEGTVGSWADIVLTEGLSLLDLDNDGTPEEYYTDIDYGSRTGANVYEWSKYQQRDDSAETLFGMNGQEFRGITHSFAYDNPVGTVPGTADQIAWGTKVDYTGLSGGPFQVGEVVHEDTADPVWRGRIVAVDPSGSLIVWVTHGTVTTAETFTGKDSGAGATVSGTPTVVTGGGVLRILAFDDDSGTGNVYGQRMNGPVPADDTIYYFAEPLTAADTTRTIQVNGTLTARILSLPFVGSFATALTGAYGIGVDPTDAKAADVFTDLSGTEVNPPNNVQFILTGLQIGDDSVLVTNKHPTLNNFDREQFAINGALTGAAVTSVVINGTVPADTPTTSLGVSTVRVQRDSGEYSRHEYSSWAGSTFTIPAADFSTDNAADGNFAFLGYMDMFASASQESITMKYDGDREMYCSVRNGVGPYKEFTNTATVTASGASLNRTLTPNL